ncbi:MAG: hypothetical protein AB7G15_11135 [Alphaproteobacteria bacterium]
MISTFKGLIGGAVLALGTVLGTTAGTTQQAQAASINIHVPGLGIHIGRGYGYHYQPHYRPYYRPYYAPYGYRPYYSAPRYCGPRTVWNGWRYITVYGC